MNLAQLDFYFPFIVMVYGLIMTLVMNSNLLMKLAREKLPANDYHKFTSHRGLGLVCLVVGALWSLQNIWVV